MNLLLKTNRGEGGEGGERGGGRYRRPNFAFGSLDCSNCLWVDGGGLRQKVLFRGG